MGITTSPTTVRQERRATAALDPTTCRSTCAWHESLRSVSTEPCALQPKALTLPIGLISRESTTLWVQPLLHHLRHVVWRESPLASHSASRQHCLNVRSNSGFASISDKAVSAAVLLNRELL